METAAGGVIAAVLGAYVIRVGIAGNSKQLMTLLSQEAGYIEFVVAGYALYLLHNQGGVMGEIIDQLIWAAAIAILIKLLMSNSNFIDELDKFGKQQQSMTTTLKHIFIGQ